MCLRNEQYIVNEEKGNVVCFFDFGRNILKDANRTGMLPQELLEATGLECTDYIVGVSYLRANDVFYESIGKRVANAKAHKQYLQAVLQGTDGKGGLKGLYAIALESVDELESYKSKVMQKRINIEKAMDKHLANPVNKCLSFWTDEEKKTVVCKGALIDIMSKKLYNNFMLQLMPTLFWEPTTVVAKLHPEDENKFSKELGLAVAERKLYRKLARKYYNALNHIQREVMQRAMMYQKLIKYYEKRLEKVLDNLKSF